MNLTELYTAEALLDDRERICLAGYLLMKENDNKAQIKAYIYSRSYQVKPEDMASLVKKVEKWWATPKVQAFLKIWEQNGEMVSSQARALRQIEQPSAEKTPEEMTAIEEIIQRYEKLYEEAEDVDDKAKILKMIVDARHKNKDEVKDEVSTTKIYLPQRCYECPLYNKEKEAIL